MRQFIALVLTITSLQAVAQDPRLNSRILDVENSLMPYVPVKGFKGWNIEDRMKFYRVPGLSIAVIRNYKIDWVKAYGFADTTQKIPVTTETMFSAGSISKFLMAVAALGYVERGHISLDSPINNYLKSWKIAENDFTMKTPVTLRMLLSHTAGTSQASYFGFTPDKNPMPTIVQILDGEKISETRRVVVNSEPNKEFRYSGGGSMIAQMALVDVTRKSFPELTQDVLFDKLGMKNSTFAQPVPSRFAPKLAWAYSAASWFKGMPYVYPQQAAAGLYSTPTDIAKFLIDVQLSIKGRGILLSEAMAKKMLTPQATVSEGEYLEQIGVGPFLIQRIGNTSPKGKYFEFTGVNAGFLAYAIASVEDGNGVVVMLNSGDNQNGIGKEIRRAVAKVYQWTNYLPDEVRPVVLTKSELDNLAGRYRVGADEVLYLRRENDYLVENINEGLDIYCFPVSKDSLVFTDFNVKAGFRFDKDGKSLSLQNVYQKEPMMIMKDDEFTPSEYLRMRRYEEAKAGFRSMRLNEYQVTYVAYDWLSRKPWDPDAVKAILEVAAEQHPNASIVYSRWGDYHLKRGDSSQAIQSYQRAVDLDPTDEQAREVLSGLKKR